MYKIKDCPCPSGTKYWAVLTGTVRFQGVLKYVKKEEILTDTHFSCLSRIWVKCRGEFQALSELSLGLDSTSLTKFLRCAALAAPRLGLVGPGEHDLRVAPRGSYKNWWNVTNTPVETSSVWEICQYLKKTYLFVITKIRSPHPPKK